MGNLPVFNRIYQETTMSRIMLPLLLFCVLIYGCTSRQQSDPGRPNIVIILSDDQGWGDLSANGNTNLQTPNIDELGSEGASFENFYVCPVCSPTRAEMLTGRYHVRGGVYSTSAGGERLDLDETTIAEIFKQAGYATAAYGKWHNGMQYPYHPNGRGFDDFYGFCSGHWGNYFSPMLEHNGKLVQGKGFVIDDFTDHALQFMEDNKGNPFLIYLPYNTPHSPMQVPDRWWDEFEGKPIEMLGRDAGQEDVQFTRAALAMCENIDWNVGRLLTKIEELGIEDNTIVLYFCDNGPNSNRWNGGMKGRKGSTNEGGVRSPLFIKWPGNIVKGRNIIQIAAAIDLLPTLADLAGIDHNPVLPLDGSSLKSLLVDAEPEWSERYIYNYWHGRLSVRNQKYRLDNNGGLFDIENDRGQAEDISQQLPDVTRQLSYAVEKFNESILTELPENDNRPFLLGHPDARYTQIPSRDGVAHGNITRSNRFPNCSFFTNWLSLEDKITWDVDVVEDGDFEVVLYYTCPEGDEGSVFELSLGNSVLTGRIEEAHDPPLQGMENDRVKRHESYVKDFKALNLGRIHASKGPAILSLRALEKPGHTVMDVRLLMFERVTGQNQ
jgi:arylsulfatase A-like enzyme